MSSTRCLSTTCPLLVHCFVHSILPPSLQVPEGTPPLQAILRAWHLHLVSLGVLTPKTQQPPLPLPGSSFRHPLVPRLFLFLLAGCCKLAI